MDDATESRVLVPLKGPAWKSFLKYFIFFAGGIAIFLWVYRGQNPDEILHGLSRFDYGWIAASFVLALLSHFMRALRWRMMLQSIGHNPKLSNTFLSVLVMYLANYALPRMGEVTRCGILKKYDRIPFTNQLGTVVAERAVDFIMLLILLLIVAAIEWGRFIGFAQSQSLDESSFMVRLFTSGAIWYFLLAGLLALAVIILFRNRLLQIGLLKKMADLGAKFMTGLKSVMKLKNPGLFIFYTLAIYFLYFGMTYSVMLGFEPTRDLGLLAGLALVTLGSVGMVVPVQGGIGSYHFFSIETLLLYGVLRDDAVLLALVLHGSMSLFLIFIGVVALLLLPWLNRRTPLKD